MPIIVDNHTFYKLGETAELLHVSRQTIYMWIRNGKLDAVKAGRDWRISQASVDDFIENGTDRRKRRSTESSDEDGTPKNTLTEAQIRAKENYMKGKKLLGVVVSDTIAREAKNVADSYGYSLSKYVTEAIKLKLFADGHAVADTDNE